MAMSMKGPTVCSNRALTIPGWQAIPWSRNPVASSFIFRSSSIARSSFGRAHVEPGVPVLGRSSVLLFDRPPRRPFLLLVASSLSATSSSNSEDDGYSASESPEDGLGARGGDDQVGNAYNQREPQASESAEAGDPSQGGTSEEGPSLVTSVSIEGTAGAEDPDREEETEEVDWDAAWAKTRRKMEKEQSSAAAFSLRKQIVASKNDDGSYDYVEISSDGVRRRRDQQGELQSEGFGFADTPVGGGRMGELQDPEYDAVNLATSNKVRASPANSYPR